MKRIIHFWAPCFLILLLLSCQNNQQASEELQPPPQQEDEGFHYEQVRRLVVSTQ